MSDETSSTEGEQPEGSTDGGDLSVVEQRLQSLREQGTQPTPATTNNDRKRHWLASGGAITEIRETVDGKPVNTVIQINRLGLAMAAYRDHHAQSSGNDMFAFRADLLLDTVIGYRNAQGEFVMHPLFADTEKFPWIDGVQLRLRVQNFVDYNHIDPLERLFLEAEAAGCVVDDDPKQREGRDTVDLMRLYAPDPVWETVLPLSGAEMSVNPLFGNDGAGNARDPFVSLLEGVNDQARRLGEPGTEIPGVVYLNGMTTIPQSGALVPKPFDCGVFTLTSGEQIRLYGTTPATPDRITGKFAALRERAGQGGATVVTPAPAALTRAQVTGGGNSEAPF